MAMIGKVLGMHHREKKSLREIIKLMNLHSPLQIWIRQVQDAWVTAQLPSRSPVRKIASLIMFQQHCPWLLD